MLRTLGGTQLPGDRTGTLLSQLKRNTSSDWGRGWLQLKQFYKHPWAEVGCGGKRFPDSWQQSRHLRHRERKRRKGPPQVLRIRKEEALIGSSAGVSNPPVLSGNKALGANDERIFSKAAGGCAPGRPGVPEEPRAQRAGHPGAALTGRPSRLSARRGAQRPPLAPPLRGHPTWALRADREHRGPGRTCPSRTPRVAAWVLARIFKDAASSDTTRHVTSLSQTRTRCNLQSDL